MSDSKVSMRADGDVHVMTICNPPVNAISDAVRRQLLEALSAARADAACRAVVLTGNARLFSGGAEISEFDAPPTHPDLREVVDAIEASDTPVVAAMEGKALGAGLALALGAHFRVAGPRAEVGLPEVKIGLVPGAGVTQRLPRLIGPVAALEPIVKGDPLSAARAAELGIIDEVLEGDLVPAAIEFARKVADLRPLRRISTEDERVEQADMAAFDAEAARLLARSRGLKAPAACVEAVRSSMTMGVDDGIEDERHKFQDLRHSDESEALRHLFFAERHALKLPGVAKDTAPREVRRIAVLGAGTMGRGITMSMAQGGYDVTMIDVSPENLSRGLEAMEKTWRRSQARGGVTGDEVDAALARVSGSSDLDDVAGADMVIEAVFEKMDLKKKVFADLDRLARPGAVLATNTSSLDVDEIAAVTGRPQDVVGMHFFSPANVMRLLENVRGAKSAPDVLVTANTVGRQAGKVPVTVGVCNGFVGNRMGAARLRQVHTLMLEGAMPARIDAAARSFGFAMGPLATNDLAGLDVGYSVRKERGEEMPVHDAIVEMGRHGQKTGRGFYIYEDGARTGTPDPEVEDLIRRIGREQGVTAREISDEEIVERLVFPLINEGAQILDEGIAARASDIDLIYVHGFGFPIATGGPMHHADRIGVATVADRLAHYAEISGNDDLRPSPLLARLAEEGRSFADHDSRSNR